MKQSVELVVVIPIGPACNVRYIADTICSIKFYIRSSYKIILADDSHKGTGNKVKELHADIEVLTMPEPMGKLCGLYVTLSLAFKHALNRYTFETLLRIDTDALVIGREPEKDALMLFATEPSIGMAGQYPLDYNGLPWDASWPQSQLRKYMHTARFFKQPLTHLRLMKHYRRACRHQYRSGESVFGGACFFSASCLIALNKKGLLPHYGLRKVYLEEDHLFSLLVKSIGYNLGSLSGPGMPFGCAWRGLPASPEALEANNKKIIHSTRFWNDMQEEDIRAWFRIKRQMDQPNALHTVNSIIAHL